MMSLQPFNRSVIIFGLIGMGVYAIFQGNEELAYMITGGFLALIQDVRKGNGE